MRALHRLLQLRVDDAKRAAQSGNVPQDLKQQVESFHQQASQAKKSGGTDENQLRQAVQASGHVGRNGKREAPLHACRRKPTRP